MKFAEIMSDQIGTEEIISSVLARMRKRYPDPKGCCANIASEVSGILKQYGIPHRHILGMFRIDEPNAFNYTDSDVEDYENDSNRPDEYSVDHEWIEVQGVILDPSISQFSDDISDDVSNVGVITYKDPVYNRYTEMGER